MVRNSEEILRKHPEIIEDVRRESERMMHERDRLQKQLHEMQGSDNETSLLWDMEAGTQQGSILDSIGGDSDEVQTLEENGTVDGSVEKGLKSGFHETQVGEIDDAKNVTETLSATINSQHKPHKPIFELKEILLEVKQQIKTDVTKVLNFIVPEPLRKQVQPMLKIVVSIAKDTCGTAYDLIKRYLMLFLNQRTVSRRDVSSGETTSNRPVSEEGNAPREEGHQNNVT